MIVTAMYAWRYNAAADYSNDKVGYASGAMDDLLDGTRDQIVQVLKSLQTELEDLEASLDVSQDSGASWDARHAV